MFVCVCVCSWVSQVVRTLPDKARYLEHIK